MIGALQTWWHGLSVREHWLIGVAGLLAAVLLGWGIAGALQSALASAHDRHAAALDRHAAVASRVAALQTRISTAPGAATAPVSLIAGQTASEAGLSLTRNDPAGDSGAAIGIAGARSTAILAMLHALQQHGVAATALTLRRNGDGTVALTASLRRTGG